jgi:hypothetical protein
MNREEQSQSLDQSFEPTPRAETSPLSTAAAASRLAPSTAGPRSVDLQIDELVLDGFSIADRHAISDAVERELARLFAEKGAPPSITYPSETAQVDGGLLETDPTSPAEAIGARVARAIYGGLNR